MTVAVAGYPGPAVVPLSPDRYRLQLTIGVETLEKLRLARDMLRHAIPSGDDAAVLDRALTALLSDLARKRFAATDTPRPSRGTAPGSRHVPAEARGLSSATSGVARSSAPAATARGARVPRVPSRSPVRDGR